MPWFFTIPEFIKKRACRYLLQHYLGQFLEEKISLDDLTVDLYNGTGSISNVPINVDVSASPYVKGRTNLYCVHVLLFNTAHRLSMKLFRALVPR